MANDTFNLKIITPIGLVSEEEVSSVKLPTSNGEIGVLAAHERYIGNLGIGILEYDSVSEKQNKRLVISQGFCSFEDNQLVILTDKVIFANSVAKDYAKEKESLKLLVANGSQTSAEWQIADSKLKEIEAIETLVA